MGLLGEYFPDGEPTFPECNIYVNPEDGFDENCIRIHGITSEKVKKEPNFPIVWEKIKSFFEDTIVIGHNVASADITALSKSCERYKIAMPEMQYICTYELAKNYIPSYKIKDYQLSTLCQYFEIDIEDSHDAFDDACACVDLFKIMVETYDIDIDKEIKTYSKIKTKEFVEYISSPMVRKSILDFYGVIRGIDLDKVIVPEEYSYIVEWRKENQKYINQKEIAEIIKVIDKIIEDGIIEPEEMQELIITVEKYLDAVAASPVTLATQVLNGILKGINLDKKVSTAEGENLRKWMYRNSYLEGYYPFDQIMSVLNCVLEDGVITESESASVVSVIDSILRPVEELTEHLNSVKGKHVCLSGIFSKGQKSDVEKLIIEDGGIIDSTVKKTTNILIIGDSECQAYAYGNYGTKVQKAIDYSNKGCDIKIIKESDYFQNHK